ncbi:terminase [Bacillus atrophaeus]|uniref:terminase n=1 Tax=Bacillus atrophaeus TaxID=1452 RepID=UPI00227F0DB9|nr:terminase [Bacillus atrophaeus]MCY8838214.1 terminase [Bacillus atrophaeus]MEC5219407.1 terminase [Bacillus atrophaeus]MED4577223.1 terminase [Bacillus atrophaeus]MED4720204.1 terminase [Bacillus atrophaeus]MED4847673.1 terminase [Bacillus atrophaeus]
MAYEEKTDWLPDDPINEDDVNRWEKGIKDSHTDLAAHKNDMNNPHNTTKAQIGLSNVDDVQQASKIEFNNHDNDSTRHITSTERTNWNAKETTAGAQKKADAAEKNAKAYTDQHRNDTNNPHSVTKDQIGLGKVTNDKQATKSEFDAHNNDQIRHISDSERTKWNGAQLTKLTSDRGKRIKIPDGTDILSLPTGFYYALGKALLNNPIEGDAAWYNYDVIEGEEGRKSIVAYQSWGVTMWIGMVHTNGEFRGWKQVATTELLDSANNDLKSHVNNKTVHITADERSKWNGSQLFKITADNGTQRINLTSGSFYESLKDVGSVSFYGTNTVTDNPSATSLRGMQLVGQPGIGIGYAVDVSGNAWWFYYNANQTAINWFPIESANAAQMRIEKAVSDAKDYTDTNFSNEKLTVLPIASGIEDARTPGTEYPFGITLMKIYDDNQTGYPLGYGLIKNEKWNNARFTQYFYGNADSRNGKNYLTGTWIRHWWLESGWTPWEKISGFAHANIGTTGIQYLEPATSTKIQFNRKIKDSHNAFDTTNNRFVAPNDGMYLVGAGLYMLNYPAYINLHIKVYLNGNAYKTLHHLRGYFENKDTELKVGLNGNATVPMNKGDYIEIYCYCNYGGSNRRGVDNQDGVFNFFDIQEIGGLNYPTV